MQLELQKLIFDKQLTRKELLEYTPKEKKIKTIQVFRNHSFELIEHTIGIYLDYARIGVKFLYTGYDDSFSFHDISVDADMVLVWIDTSRYKLGTVGDFLTLRIRQLRKVYFKSILVVPVGELIAINEPGVYSITLEKLEKKLGPNFYDFRTKTISGTSLSRKAMLELSRVLGLTWIPNILNPALKAIVVDLDNTLYRGVLAEEGIEGIELTEDHKKVQLLLKSYASNGLFLCIASKNEREDVRRLFRIRSDFPLSEDDFTCMCVSWDEKVKSIGKIANYLNIDTDSMVFIDDNIGELISVQMAWPHINIICADPSGSETLKVLKEFPGINVIHKTDEDNFRSNDIKANQQRKELQRTMLYEEYIKSLNLQLTYSTNNLSQIERISVLSNKTNQFIFNYKRYTQSDLQMRMKSTNYTVVSFSLNDRLSDSGLIGVCVGVLQKEYVEIEEVFISCRALGRGIDDIMVMEAIQRVLNHFNIRFVKVDFKIGARNKPAEEFARKYLEGYLETPAEFKFKCNNNSIKIIEN